MAVFARNIGTKLCQTLNKPSKFCPRLWIFCQSGKSLPNLVTLKAPEVRVCSLIEIDRERTYMCFSERVGFMLHRERPCVYVSVSEREKALGTVSERERECICDKL